MKEPTELPPLLDGVKTIVFIGDSITEAGDPGNGYVSLFRDALKRYYPEHEFNVINAGIGGHKAPDMLKRFDQDVLLNNPQLVFLSVGINDVWHGFGDNPSGVPLEEYKACVRKMIEKTEEHPLHLVILSPTVIQEDSSSPENLALIPYIEAERELASEYFPTFVDLHTAFLEAIAAKRGTPLTTDGVHLTDSGNRLMAFEILKAIEVEIESPDDLPESDFFKPI